MDVKYAPDCPFCGRFIKRPEKIRIEFGDIIASWCLCGALYACDPTGKNLGEVFVDALALFTGDWDIGSKTPDKDYFTKEYDYDLKSHRYINIKGENPSSGKLIFINNYAINSRNEARVKRLDVNIKNILIEYLNSQDYQKIAEMVETNHSLVSKLISLSYDKDDLIAWRAIQSFKEISIRLTPIDQNFMRNTIRRLLWSMSDESGGIGWSACEILGMIISANVKEYSDVIPLLWSFREEEMFKSGVMWAIYHIALIDRDALYFVCEELLQFLTDKNPYVRVYSLSSLNTIGCNVEEEKFDMNSIITDETITYYEKGQFHTSKVSDAIKSLTNRDD